MHSLFRRGKAPAADGAVPAPMPMPMLTFPGKKALPFAGDTSAAERDADLPSLMLARAHVVALAASDSAAGKKQQASTTVTAGELRNYLRHIYASEMKGASRHQLLRFAWRDAGWPPGAVSGSKKTSCSSSSSSSSAAAGQGHTSLATEHAVALFALAAELARAAAEEDRRGADGIRRACRALADAAGALSAATSKGRGAAETSGLCHMTDECLAAFERLMLAQALECYFELAVAGGKPPAVCAKIARQVSLDYQQVSIALDSLHQQPIDKSWAPHAQAKSAYFRAEACLLRARALRDEGAGCVGEAIARLRYATSAVLDGSVGKAAIKKSAQPVRDAAAWLRREVEAELAAAEKDNCQVFFERVPAADALPALPGLSEPLVRPTAVEKVVSDPDY
ncbi:hypothetical protein EJB05_23905, partial [Eragrostis curvula]